jgi:hypothetical protein
MELRALACDNLRWAEIVTADGKIRACSAGENPDLFWGLRGAGANFGIVTELDYTLHPLSSVFGGVIFYPLGGEVFRFYDEFSRSEPLRTFGTPIADLIQQRPYLEIQSLFDPINPPGRRYYNKAHNISKVHDGAIDTVFQFMAKVPAPNGSIAFQQLHGAAARVPATDTAFPHRLALPSYQPSTWSSTARLTAAESAAFCVPAPRRRRSVQSSTAKCRAARIGERSAARID